MAWGLPALPETLNALQSLMKVTDKKLLGWNV